MSNARMSRRKMLTLLATGAAALVAPVLPWDQMETALAQTTPENLNQLLEPIRVAHGMPALAAAFISGPDLVGLGAVGVRKAGAFVAVQPNDQFHLGSDTKSMTATLLGRLVEQGKISWDTTVAQVFPDMLDKIRPEYRQLTLIPFLSHRAGIPGNETPAPYNDLQSQLWTLRGALPQQRRAVVEMVLSRPPVSLPGSVYSYSNLGYIIAGSFAEQVTGQTWESLMRSMLFEPLGMQSAGFGAPGTADTLDQPWGHTSDGQPVSPGPNADNPPVLGPAGTVHCSMSDWGLYASLHLLGAQGVQGLLLKPQTLQDLQSDRYYHQGYALGWGVASRDWAAGTTLSHGGSNTLWYADIWIAPQRNAAFLAATNRGGDSAFQACDATVGAMIQKYL